MGGLCLNSSAAEWNHHGNYRAATIKVPQESSVGFRAMPASQTGVNFENMLPVARHYTNQILLNGSGVAAADFDQDGHCDLFLAGLNGQSRLYRNQGNWQFEDATRQLNQALEAIDATGVVAADIDGDRDMDLVVNSVGQGTRLLLNDGEARFSPSPAVMNPDRCGTSSSMADLDGDGDLDLYVANYRMTTMRDEPQLGFTMANRQGKPEAVAYGNRSLNQPDLRHRFRFHYEPAAGGSYTIFHDEQGESDVILQNQGDGTFTTYSVAGGVFQYADGTFLQRLPFDWGLSVMLRDLNHDGTADIYVCNDFSSPDRQWINLGQGRFRELDPQAIRQSSLSSMAVDVADLDRDGHDDIFTADMLSPARWRRLIQINRPNPNIQFFEDVEARPQVSRNVLWHAREDGTYAEIAQMAGLEATDWSWACIFLDVDLDGYEDLLVANGFERDFMNMDVHRRVQAMQARVPRNQPPHVRLASNRLYPRLATPNLAFRNQGNLTFQDLSATWNFHIDAVSHGMCVADFDNDGDLDVAINNLNGPASLLQNTSSAPRLAVRLKGHPPNTMGIGARIQVRSHGLPTQSQIMLAGGRYLSADDAIRVFAAQSATQHLHIEVSWPDGTRSSLTNVAPNQIVEIFEPDSAPSPKSTSAPASTTKPPSLFADLSDTLSHSRLHEIQALSANQDLTPVHPDARGSGLSWLDLTGDQLEELLLPAGRGAKPAAFAIENTHSAQSVLTDNASPIPSPAGYETSRVGWSVPNGPSHTLSAWWNDSRQSMQVFETVRQKPNNPWETTIVAELPSTRPGPLALADVDLDGDLDLFVGTQSRHQRWPEPGRTSLFLQEKNSWREDAQSTNAFHDLGLVQDARFADLDLDGDPDLAVTLAWNKLCLFQNHQGAFTPWDWPLQFKAALPGPTPADALSKLTGRWNGLAAGDFDQDGRLDLVAGNWGRNSKYEAFRDRPIRIYYGDFIGDGRVNIVETWFAPDLEAYAPIRDVWTLASSMPWLLARFDSFQVFSRASIDEVLGPHRDTAKILEAAWWESAVFLNRGDYFLVQSLPREAQASPVLAPVVADFDGDGSHDLFLSQNYFAVASDNSRHDAGRGLLLRGDGQGNFHPLTGSESGVKIYAEQRGAATADFDQDGKADLAVMTFNGTTRLLHNRRAKPGLRVRLMGPKGNPQAIGAKLRLRADDHWGPVTEIHAGGGFGSQDGATAILTHKFEPTHLWIRWPDGDEQTTNLSPEIREISLTPQTP